MKIEIPWDAADHIVLSVLKNARRNLIKDAKDNPFKVFNDDETLDKAEIKKHIDAFNVVIKYFSV